MVAANEQHVYVYLLKIVLFHIHYMSKINCVLFSLKEFYEYSRLI